MDAEEEFRHPATWMPGCGLMFYVGILFIFFSLGVVGITMTVSTVIQSSMTAPGRSLAYGGAVSKEWLTPYRDAGLIPRDGVPDAIHAEDDFGTESCALYQDTLIRIDRTGPHILPIAAIASLDGKQTNAGWVVTIDGALTRGTGPIVCTFAEGEGGERFLRMLEVARKPAAP